MVDDFEPNDESSQAHMHPRPPVARDSVPPRADQPTSTVLAELVHAIPANGVTLREFLAQLGERGLLMFSMVLTVPFLMPVSIPGSSLPFGLLIALNGMGLITHRTPWLPDRLMNRRLARTQVVALLGRGVHLFSRLEKLIHPRLLPLTHGATMGRINGILLVLSGLLLMVPLPLPFSNTLPAYGALLLAAGSLERDGYFVVAGYVMVLLTVAYFNLVVVLGEAGVRALLTYL